VHTLNVKTDVMEMAHVVNTTNVHVINLGIFFQIVPQELVHMAEYKLHPQQAPIFIHILNVVIEVLVIEQLVYVFVLLDLLDTIVREKLAQMIAVVKADAKFHSLQILMLQIQNYSSMVGLRHVFVIQDTVELIVQSVFAHAVMTL
jgi:hypothetical protein